MDACYSDPAETRQSPDFIGIRDQTRVLSRLRLKFNSCRDKRPWVDPDHLGTKNSLKENVPSTASATDALFMFFLCHHRHGLYLHPAYAGANVL